MHQEGRHETPTPSISYMVLGAREYWIVLCPNVQDRAGLREPAEQSADADQGDYSIQQHAELAELNAVVIAGRRDSHAVCVLPGDCGYAASGGDFDSGAESGG